MIAGERDFQVEITGNAKTQTRVVPWDSKKISGASAQEARRSLVELQIRERCGGFIM